MQLNHPIKLKRLEIQEWSEAFFLDFLNAFEGLEELFVSEAGPTSALELWEHAARRHPTLKKFVGHQRMINTNEDSPHFERPCDVPDLGICGHDMRRIKEDPSQNPLAKLDLEFIGVPCMPKRLVSHRRPHQICKLIVWLIEIYLTSFHVKDFIKGSSHPPISLRSQAMRVLGHKRGLSIGDFDYEKRYVVR